MDSQEAKLENHAPFYALTRWLWFAFSFYYLTQLIGHVQHTYVAIYASLTAVLAAADAAIHGQAWKKYAAILLFTIALVFRFDAWQAGLLLACFLGLIILADPKKRPCLRRYLKLIACMGLIAIILNATWHAADVASPEWKTARAFNTMRTVINDTPDNSGLDKNGDWASLHLSPADVALFKRFVYSPAWENIQTLDHAAAIHRSGRIGLFNDSLTAQFGFFRLHSSALSKMIPDAVAATPWIPLFCLAAAFLLFPNRRRLPTVLGTIAFLAVYVALLLAVDRPVARVLLPAIAIAALLTGACLPTKKGNRHGTRVRSVLLVFMATAGFLVTFRHDRHFDAAQLPEPISFCRANPDLIFFSLSLQNTTRLYPAGFLSHPLDTWKNSNIVPIGDGWMFYTPVYKDYLKKRGIDDPWLALTRENARLVTYTPHESERLFQWMQTYYKERFGFDVDFTEEKLVSPCRFWRVQTKFPSVNNRNAQ